MKHPRVCKECGHWVVTAEDDGYCRRPGFGPEPEETRGEEKDPFAFDAPEGEAPSG